MNGRDEMERIDCNGVSVVAAGPREAPPLMLLHGIGSNAGSFVPLMSKLSASRRLYAWDAPGYGSSVALTTQHPTSADYAAVLSGVLDELGVDRLELVGHSLGCLVAGRFATLYPDRVPRLYLLSPAIGHRSKPGEPMSANAQARADALAREGAAEFAAKRGPRLVYDRSGRADVVAAVVSAMAEVKLPGYAQACHLLSTGDLVAEAATIRAPTLVAVGAGDEITPPDNCRKVYDALAAATPDIRHRFELVDAAGHAVVQEQPAAVARLIGQPAVSRTS